MLSTYFIVNVFWRGKYHLSECLLNTHRCCFLVCARMSQPDSICLLCVSPCWLYLRAAAGEQSCRAAHPVCPRAGEGGLQLGLCVLCVCHSRDAVCQCSSLLSHGSSGVTEWETALHRAGVMWAVILRSSSCSYFSVQGLCAARVHMVDSPCSQK